MRKITGVLQALLAALALCAVAPAARGADSVDVPAYAQIDMQVQPTKPTHVTRMIDVTGAITTATAGLASETYVDDLAAALEARIDEILASIAVPPEPPDTTPPTVSIAASKTSATTGETVAFTVSASDNVGVVSKSFTFNGVTHALNSNDQVSLAMPNSAGQYTAEAVATDAAGNAGNATQVITVALPPDTTPPTVSIAASKTSATTGESVTFTVTASDNVGVTSKSFTFNGSSYTLNSSNQVAITMPSTAGTTVNDAAGNTGSASLNVTVAVPNRGFSGSVVNGVLTSSINVIRYRYNSQYGAEACYQIEVLKAAVPIAPTSLHITLHNPLTVAGFPAGVQISYFGQGSDRWVYRVQLGQKSKLPDGPYYTGDLTFDFSGDDPAL